MKNIYFDPDGKVSYGYYRCPDCGSSFFAGGPPLHEKVECSKVDYDQLDYHFNLPELAGRLTRASRSKSAHKNFIEFLDRVKTQYPDVYARALAMVPPPDTKGTSEP